MTTLPLFTATRGARKPHELIRLAGVVRSRWKIMSLALLLSMVNQGTGLALAAASAVLVGLVAAGALDTVGLAIGVIVGLTALKAVLNWLDQWGVHVVAVGIMANLRSAAYAALEPLAPAYTLKRRSGDIVAMVMADVEAMQVLFSRTLVPSAVTVLLSTTVLVILLAIAPVLALTLVPFLVIVLGLPLAGWRFGLPLAKAVREAQGTVSAHLVDSIQGLRELVAFGRGRDRVAEVRANSLAFGQAQHRNARFLGAITGTTDVAVSLGGLSVLLTGMSLVASGVVDRAVLPLILMLAFTAFRAVTEVSDVAKNLTQVTAAARRYFAVFDEPVVVRDSAVTSPGAVAPRIAFERVTFRYHADEPDVLRDVSFTVEPGETVALVGPSGSGKSTCANLLLRFWDPQAGRVTLGGVDLRDYPLDDLRQRIAIVQQENYLFNVSIRENLRLGRPSATDAAIEVAARQANIHDFIVSLPKGYDTVVGERGVKLSGGQRQRIAIARALVKDAPILVLDEATSNLDTENEQLIRDAIARLTQGRTVLVIAHRLATISAADRVVMLDGGQVVATGSHAALLADDTAYARLVAGQRRESERA